MRNRVGVVALMIAGACAKESASNEPAPTSARVEARAETLLPEEVRIRVGGTVQWINMDNQAHHLVSGTPSGSDVGRNFDSDTILGPPGFQPFRDFTVTFADPAEVRYFCTEHPATMLGKVIVVR